MFLDVYTLSFLAIFDPPPSLMHLFAGICIQLAICSETAVNQSTNQQGQIRMVKWGY